MLPRRVTNIDVCLYYAKTELDRCLRLLMSRRPGGPGRRNLNLAKSELTGFRFTMDRYAANGRRVVQGVVRQCVMSTAGVWKDLAFTETPLAGRIPPP